MSIVELEAGAKRDRERHKKVHTLHAIDPSFDATFPLTCLTFFLYNLFCRTVD